MLNGIIQNNAIEDEVFSPDSMTIPNINGMKLSDNNPANFNGQIIYVDFDGANNVTYNNAALNISVSDIDVAKSGMDQTSINQVISELNTAYAGSGVYFTIAPDPSLLTHNSSLASTIYVGNTGSAFAQYGKFLGLSETIDVGNQIKNDNAFVFSDKIISTDQLTATITHEAGHLIGYKHSEQNLSGDSAQEALNSYAYTISIEEGGSMHQFIGIQALALYNEMFGIAGVTLEISRYFGTEGINTVSYGSGASFIEGEYEEDMDYNLAGNYYLRHFCAGGDGDEINQGLVLFYDSAYERANGVTYNNAKNNYIADTSPDINSSAYYWLGRTAHLLQDMCVPAHVHNDSHGISEPYEQTVYNYRDYSTYDGDGYFDYDGDTSYYASYSDFLTRVQKYGSLETLFRETTDYTDDYDSADVAGDYYNNLPGDEFSGDVGRSVWHKPANVDGSGDSSPDYGMSGEEIIITAQDLVPWAVEQTAALIRFFYTEKGLIATGPSGLTYTGKSATGISLDWDNTASAAGYVIFGKEAAANDYSYLTSTQESEYNASNLLSGTAYDYRVYSYTSQAGLGNYSDISVASLPMVTIAVHDAVAGEPEDNGLFRITRTGDTASSLTVYFTTDGTATSGSDYTLKNGIATLTDSVVIASGESYVDVTLGVVDDDLIETTETATMSLAANAAYALDATNSSTVNITSNDPFTPIVSSQTVNNETINSGTQSIVKNGIANSATIAGGFQNISSGGIANDTAVNSLGIQNIYSCGVANGTTINTSGYQYICYGGTVNSATVNSGGFQIVLLRGIANATTVNTNGYQFVYTGGTANGTIVNTNGKMYVSSGGVASAATLSGGSQNIYTGGTANGTIVNTNGKMYMSSGGVANNTTVNSLGIQNISNGAIANSTIINSIGGQNIYTGGSASGTTLAGGSQNIYTGGVATGTIVNLNGGMYVSSGGIANNARVNSLGSQNVYTGGIANSTTVNSDGNQNIYTGGIANAATVNSLGIQHLSGGIASGTTLAGGSQNISSGGIANETIVNLNGKMCVSSGGTANNATINAYGLQNIYAGGVANSALINAGGQNVSSGGTANATTVSKGNQVIYSGGIASGAVIKSGTWQGVSSGGVANNTTLNAGWQYLYTGGVASATTINSAGYQVISSGGTASGAVFNSGYQVISSGGAANSTTLNAGGSQIIKGLAIGVTINSGGVQFLSSGGVTSETVANLNGKIYVYSSGTANNTTLDGGVQNIYAVGIANSTTINSGVQIVFTGGVANSTTVSKGNQVVSSGGIANGAIIGSGTWQGAYSGGVVNNTVLNAGWQYLFAGGVASAASVNSRGYQVISSGGTASGTIVNSGYQIISSGGTANTATINSGGSQIIKGLANNAIINAGVQFISSGGSANGTVANLNGKIYVYSGGTTNGTTLAGGIQNIYTGGGANSTTINSGGQYVTGGTANDTTVNKGNQLISSGGIANNAVINSGTWQGIYSGGVANNTILNTGWQYLFTGGVANATTVNSAGYQVLSSGGVANGTNVNLSGKQIVYSGGTANSATVNSGGSVFVSSGGILSGSLTIDGGHVTVAYSENMQTSTVNFELAAAQTNDALLVIQTGVTGDISGFTFNLNIDNTATGSYILADVANLTSMSNVTFSVMDNGQNVNMQVGISYTFADGDELSLSFIDSTRDKLIATFTHNPPTAPPPIVFNLNAEMAAASTFDNAKIVDSVEQSGWVSLAGNDDDYRFDLASPVTGGTLRLHDLTGGNADLSLYNASGTLLQSSNNTGTLEDSIISNLDAGTYFARVNAVSGNIDYKLDFDQKYVTGMLTG